MEFAIKALGAVALMTGTASAQNLNLDVFAGQTLPAKLVFVGVHASTNPGQSYGIGISRSDVFTPNLELGFELSQTRMEYAGFEPISISGLAAMATARYNFVNTGAFEAYAGLGLGAVNVTFTSVPPYTPYTNSAVLPGGQVMLGARYAVSDQMKMFAEARYLDTFQDAADIAFGTPATFNASSIVLGIRTSF